MRIFRFSFFVFSILFCTFSLGQAGNRYAVKKAYEIPNTTLLVILDNTIRGKESPYNIAIRNAMDKYWTVTNIEYKRASEVSDFIPAEGFSMLVKSFREVENADGYTVQSHSDISIFLCNKDSIKYYGGMDEIASINIPNPDSLIDINYKLPILIQSMQYYLSYAVEKKLDPDNFLNKMKKFYTQNRAEIPKSTLYICKEELPAGFESEKLAKFYKYPFEILERSKLKKRIDARTEGSAIMHFEPKYRRYWILRISDGTVLSVGSPALKGIISLKDFKNILKNR